MKRYFDRLYHLYALKWRVAKRTLMKNHESVSPKGLTDLFLR
jgi:hypothetical protein